LIAAGSKAVSGAGGVQGASAGTYGVAGAGAASAVDGMGIAALVAAGAKAVGSAAGQGGGGGSGADRSGVSGEASAAGGAGLAALIAAGAKAAGSAGSAGRLGSAASAAVSDLSTDVRHQDQPPVGADGSSTSFISSEGSLSVGSRSTAGSETERLAASGVAAGSTATADSAHGADRYESHRERTGHPPEAGAQQALNQGMPLNRSANFADQTSIGAPGAGVNAPGGLDAGDSSAAGWAAAAVPLAYGATASHGGSTVDVPRSQDPMRQPSNAATGAGAGAGNDASSTATQGTSSQHAEMGTPMAADGVNEGVTTSGTMSGLTVATSAESAQSVYVHAPWWPRFKRGLRDWLRDESS